MTWQDPIVEEVRAIREAYAARFNYDLQAIYHDLKEQERQHGWKMVSLPPRPAKHVERAVGPRPQ
ncbi:MAG: hypothetical protein HYZ72_09880 [Deltaproteobacteria bacterium]|nr:hypothetical protein [Deltaproteobacteria bacterium]